MNDIQPREGLAPHADHRAAVVGVRQLRHPLQGVRPARRPARSRTRRSPTPPRCTASPGVAPTRRRCTSRGTASTTTAIWPSTPSTSACASGRSTPTSSRTTTTSSGSVTNPDPRDPPQGDRPPPRVRRRDGRHRVVRPQAVVLRRHQLPRPGRHRDPSGAPRRRPRRGLRPPRRRLSASCSSTSSSSRRSTPPTCPTGGRRTCTAPRSGPRRWSWSIPATTRPARTSSSSWRCCCGPASSAASTSTPASTPTTT